MRKRVSGKVVVLGMSLAVVSLLVGVGLGGDWSFAVLMRGNVLLLFLLVPLLLIVLPVAIQNLATFLMRPAGAPKEVKPMMSWDRLAPGWRFLLLVFGGAMTALPALFQRPDSVGEWATSIASGAGFLIWALLSIFSGNPWICGAMLIVPAVVFLL